MNLPSTKIVLEVAKVGDQYIVRYCYDNGAGSIGGEITDVMPNRESLFKCIGVLVNHVPR